MLQTHEQKSKIRLVTTVIAVLVIAGVVVLADHLKSQENTTATSSANTTSSTNTETSNATDTTTTANSSTTSGTVKDGTYSASNSYTVPHGTEEIHVSVTLKNGVITDASVQNSESDFDSKQYQEEFTAGYKTKVVGKKISGLQISVIAGASDTTDGFNEALSEIAAKAEA